MEIDENGIAKILSTLIRQRRLGRQAAGCPNEEKLAAYLGSGLTRTEKTQVENHLAGCSYCLDVIVAANEAAGVAQPTVPQWLMSRAKSLVRPGVQREGAFELVLRLARGAIELVSTSGRLITVAVPVLRGPAGEAESRIVQVEKEVGRFKVGVEVESIEAGLCQAVVSVKDETGKPADGIRLSLLSGAREQASFLTRGGEVLFERLSPGEYTVSVSEAGTQVGAIRLSLTREL